MTTSRRLTIPILATILAVLVPATLNAGQVLCLTEADDIEALQLFEQKVHRYVELHHSVAFPLTAAHFSADAEAIAKATAALAAAVCAARGETGKGEIFVPEVADLFRGRLMRSAAAHDYAALIPLGRDDDRRESVAEVNRAVPWTSVTRVSPAILAALPGLPLALEYRFVHRDLVIVDLEADLVVDILDEALPLW